MTDDTVVQVAALAIELAVDVDVVLAELGDDVFRSGGFRVTSATRAAELIAAHEQRKEAAEATAKRKTAAAARAAEEARAASQARGQALREQAAAGVSRLAMMRVTKLTEVAGTGDVPAVAAMTADAPAEYEGGTMTPRPSALDWLTGQAEGGATIGPVRRTGQKGG